MTPLVCSHCQTACAAPPGYQGQGLLCPTCGQLIAGAAPFAMPVGASYHVGETPLASPAAPPAYGDYDLPEAELIDDSPAAETIAAPRARFRLGSWLLVILLLLLGGMLLLAATAVGYVAIARARGQPIVNPLRSDRPLWSLPGDEPDDIHWTPAENHSLIAGPARVQVMRVEIGETRGKDAAGNVIVSDGDFLQILLRIENVTPLPLDYRSWYGNEFSDPRDAQQPQRVRLRDNADRPYSWVIFDDVARVRWHTPAATIAPRKFVEDVIVFELPPGATKENLQYLRLELPAAAVGFRDGSYRFEIPRTMIEGLSGSQSLQVE